MGLRSETGRVLRESWREVRDENVTFMAGSIAYHAFVSMLPLLLFVLVVLSAVGNEAFTARLAELTGSFLTPYARRLLVESLDATAARTGVSVVGGLTLLWGTSKIFRGLDVAFSEIYDSHADKSLLAKFENGVVVFAALGTAVAAFVAAGSVAALVPDLPYPAVVNPLLLVVGLAVAFVPIYYVFPDVDLTLWEVLPGVLFAAVGWAALEALFQGYVAFVTQYEAIYGTLGSAFFLLIWFYFSGLVLLVGGVLNAVLAGRTDDEHALHVTEEVSADAQSPDDRNRTPDDRNRAPDDRNRASGDRNRALDGRRTHSGDGDDSARGDGPARGDAESDRTDPESDHNDGCSDVDPQRLRRRVERLEAENDRLRRANDHLSQRLMRRSAWARAKRWVVGEG